MLFCQQLSRAIKLVLALTISSLMAEASIKATLLTLDGIPCIYYLFRFCKDKENKMRALINSSSEVNAMTQAYTSKLGLKICRTNVGAQKINRSTFETFGMILANF